MRRLSAMVLALALGSSACIGGGAGSPTVLVDFSHDEFSSYFLKFYPSRIAARPGDELVFKQTWTGEPHTVTGGTLANRVGELVRPYIDDLRAGRPLPDEPPEDIIAAEERIGFVYGAEEGLNQTLAQPCYLSRGAPAKDAEPCRNRRQPVFDGSHTLYNSGVIPYEGPQGNDFRLRLAEDLEPGNYFFYCVVHGSIQSTEVEVKPADEEVPSPEEVARAARREINRDAEPLAELFRDARDRRITMRPPGGDPARITGNFAGLARPDLFFVGVNEFVPRRIRVRAGEPITWNVIGGHTISFGVPRYFPIIEFERDGTVKRNPRLDPPAGGAPKIPDPEDGPPPSEPMEVDAGTYDGRGFWSSGTMYAQPYIEYTMRITRPGRYRYACLIHPPMVGTVEVT